VHLIYVSEGFEGLGVSGLPSTPNMMNRERAKGVSPRCGSALTGVERLGGAVVMTAKGSVETINREEERAAVMAKGVGALVNVEGSCSLGCSICEVVKEESVVIEEPEVGGLETDAIKDEIVELVVIVEKLIGVVTDASIDDNDDVVASVD
jgi:hypothetical protein